MHKNMKRVISLFVYGLGFLVSLIFLILAIVAWNIDSPFLVVAAIASFWVTFEDTSIIQKQRATIEKLRSIIANKEHH